MEPITAVTNEQVLQNLNPPNGKKKWFMALFVITLILVAGFGGFYLVQKFSPLIPVSEEIATSATPAPVLPIGDAELSFLSTNNKAVIGSKIPVNVQLTTNGRIISRAEINIKYDQKALDLDTTPFTNGKIFLKDPVISKDSVKGLVRITGDLGEIDKGFSGIGVLGTMNFVAKSESVNILSAKGSSLVNLLTKQNILGKLYGLEIIITK